MPNAHRCTKSNILCKINMAHFHVQLAIYELIKIVDEIVASFGIPINIAKSA